MATLGAEFVGFAVAGAACCCIGGSALFLREYNSAYTAVAMHEATEDEDEDYSIPSFKIENPLPMREQTLDEDDVAEGASTKDGELNLLSNIRKMPKFK